MPSLPHRPHVQFYGRRSIRGLKETEKELLARVLPAVQLTQDKLPLILDGQKPLVLEIGFGGGEHLATQAQNNPSKNYIGCEPFINGVISLLRHIDENSLSNVFVYPLDARLLFPDFQDHSLDEVFLLFPDPWPKKRHAKRRFIQPEIIQELARLLKPGGVFKTATDHPLYQEWVFEQFGAQSLFDPIHETPWQRPSEAVWPRTRYEQKAIDAGKKIAYFTYEKK
jgi:tRNA (guanine-N7-)-methyltransferase